MAVTPPASLRSRTDPNSGGLKRTVIALLGGASVLIAYCVMVYGLPSFLLSPKQLPKEAEALPTHPGTPDAVKGLPGNYDHLLKQAQAAPPAEQHPAPPQQAPSSHPQAPAQKPVEKNAREYRLGVVTPKEAGDSAITPPMLPPMPPPEEGKQGGRPSFLERSAQLDSPTVNDRIHTPASPFMLLAGTYIPASLEQGINSDLPGYLKARVRESVYDTGTGQHLLIPQGSVIIGRYDDRIVWGQDRVLIAWTRLVMPNGTSIQLEGMPGEDLAGYAGLKDRVDHHLFKLFTAVLMSSVLSVGSRAPFQNPQGFQPTLQREFAQDFGSAANQAGQSIVTRQLNQQPTITIPPGMSVLVFCHKDLLLQRYQQPVTRK
jgi:type IV secretory pathway VirB10-like protein